MHACARTRVQSCMHACTCAHTHQHVDACAHSFMHMQACTHTFECIGRYAHACTNTHEHDAHTHARMRARTHTRTHAHTHARIRKVIQNLYTKDPAACRRVCDMERDCSAYTMAWSEEGSMDYCAIFLGSVPDAADHDPNWMCVFNTKWVETVKPDVRLCLNL